MEYCDHHFFASFCKTSMGQLTICFNIENKYSIYVTVLFYSSISYKEIYSERIVYAFRNIIKTQATDMHLHFPQGTCFRIFITTRLEAGILLPSTTLLIETNTFVSGK